MESTTRNQTSISREVSVSGFGFWSGRDTTVTFQPAKANEGIVFVRTDIPGQPQIAAIIQNRVNGPRRTTLVNGGVAVEMVEHVLAALAGLRIDNCRILVDRAEMPGCDGSSLAFVNALSQVDIVTYSQPRTKIFVREVVRVGDEFSWIEARPNTRDELELNYELSYSCSAIGSQTFQSTVQPHSFRNEVASARTFVLQHEAEQLRQQGKGERVTYKDVLIFNEEGPIENTLRFDNECARHKVLDMVGDFSLAGADIVGKFTASRSGHRLNSQMVFALLQQICTENKPIRIPA